MRKRQSSVALRRPLSCRMCQRKQKEPTDPATSSRLLCPLTPHCNRGWAWSAGEPQHLLLRLQAYRRVGLQQRTAIEPGGDWLYAIRRIVALEQTCLGRMATAGFGTNPLYFPATPNVRLRRNRPLAEPIIIAVIAIRCRRRNPAASLITTQWANAKVDEHRCWPTITRGTIHGSDEQIHRSLHRKISGGVGSLVCPVGDRDDHRAHERIHHPPALIRPGHLRSALRPSQSGRLRPAPSF